MYTVATERLFRSSAIPLLRVLSCSSQFSLFLSHVIPLLSDLPITFQSKQLSFRVLKY